MSQTVGHVYFYDNFGNSGPIFVIFSLLNSERICKGRRNLNYHLPLNLLPPYLAKRGWSTIHLYIHISENNMLCVKRHLFQESLFVYLSFLPDTDVITTFVQYFVWSITDSFQLRRKNVWHSIEQHTVDASVDQRHSWLKHACVCRRRTFLNTRRKTIYVEKQRSNILREHYCN